MKHTSCLEVHSFSAIQEIPSILRKQKVHFRVQKSPPLVPILNQINLVRTLPSHLFKINFDIILPSSLRLPSGPFLQVSEPQSYMHISFPLTCQFRSYIIKLHLQGAKKKTNSSYSRKWQSRRHRCGVSTDAAVCSVQSATKVLSAYNA
jgi:hypothetical protein